MASPLVEVDVALPSMVPRIQVGEFRPEWARILGARMKIDVVEGLKKEERKAQQTESGETQGENIPGAALVECGGEAFCEFHHSPPQ